MNKTKIILAAIGGVSVLAALVLAYLIWEAMSANAESADAIASAESGHARSIAAAVYPDKDGLRSVETNRHLYAAWQDAAFALASQYDRAFDETTPPAFKSFMVADAKRLAALPGAADGRLVANEFGFGFGDYITGGRMPSAADLPRLQREWFDVSKVVGILADAGVEQVTSIEVAVAPKADATKDAKKDKNAKKNKKGAKEVAPKLAPQVTRLNVGFLTRPAAFVRALDAFAVTNRFIVVEDFSFVRAADDLGDALGAGGAKKDAEQAGGRRRRTRARDAEKAAAEAKAAEEKRKGALTDPETASPMKATVRLAIYDFGAPKAEAVDTEAAPRSDEKPEEQAAASAEKTEEVQK